MALSNYNLWNYVRNLYPSFASHTSKATKELFTEKGFEQLQSFDGTALNDFFGLSLRVFLQKITAADVKDVLAEQDFGESYDTPWGGFAQRIAIDSIKPVSPAFKGLQDGDSPDPFVVRKPATKERFYDQNFDYQSLVTIPDMGLYKNMWVQEYGMSEYMAGIMKGLANGYKLQKTTTKLNLLNEMINSETYPLKETQSYVVNLDYEEPTPSGIIEFIELIRNIVDSMVYAPATGAFNTLGFESTQDKDNLRLLITPLMANKLATISRLNSPEDMSIPIPVVKVPNFGGLTPSVTSDSSPYVGGSIRLASDAEPTYATYKAAAVSSEGEEIVITNDNFAGTPIYDDFGTIVAYAFYNSTAIATVGEATFKTIYIPVDQIRYNDPNNRTLAVIADKRILFENIQNPYTVEPIRNPRGLYTNYWASSANNSIKLDRIYNVAKISINGD